MFVLNLELPTIFIYHQNKLKITCPAPLKKGKAITGVFDPIQIQNHGMGVFGDISENVEVRNVKEKEFEVTYSRPCI